MKTVIIISPYKPVFRKSKTPLLCYLINGIKYLTIKIKHWLYLKSCMCDCLMRIESPYAPHGILTKVLNDNDPEDRALGIKAGRAWFMAADVIAVYHDLGISEGMKGDIAYAQELQVRIEYRTLLNWK